MPVQIFRAGDTLNPNESISSLPAKPGDTITFDVVYETKNDNGTTPAVGGETLKPFPLYVNFNSNELALVPGTAKYPNTYGSTPLIKAENLAVTPDTADEDAGQPNSQETNAYIFATWLSFSDWTGLDSQPAPLLRLSFNVLDGFNGSTVNFTTIAKEQQDSAPGFTFTPQSLQLVAPTTAGITVAPTTGLTTDEAGKTDTFTVKLDAPPTADVTIPVASSDPLEGTAAPTSLVFTAANWNTAQTVTVTGVADNTVDADKPYTIQLQPAVSTDPNYTGIDATDVSVTNTNVDVAPVIPVGIITVATTTGLTSESGTTTTFTVKLDTKPTADVTIPVLSSNTAEGTAAPTSLVFTAANWDTAQTVTVTGVADKTVDADQVYTIQLQPAVSTDPNYTGKDATDVSVTNTNVDVANITVAPTTGLTSESGTTTTFTVKLDTKPTADVTIPVLSSNTAEGTAAPANLVFTAANWDTAQTVTVTGVADGIVDADKLYTIQLQPAVSTDTNYTGKDATDVSVTNTNVDVAKIIVAPTTGLTSESGTTTTFTVKLDTKPTADVTIPVLSSNTAEGTAAPTSLVFTAANWDTAQTVTVTGVPDKTVDADQVYTIQLQPAVSTDPNYTGKDATDVAVTNTNVDVANITVAPTTGLTSESGTTTTFTVKLDTKPTADVTIPVASSNTAEGTAAPTSLVFTAANWDTAQTVTVTGVADGIVDADQAYTIQLQPAVSDDANYTGIDAADVQVTNTNIDQVIKQVDPPPTPNITVTPTSGLTTDESGKTATFTVKLDTQPTADVTIPVLSSDPKEGTAAPTSLVFTAANWDTAQTVTVTGVADGIVDADKLYTIQLQAAVSDDPNYTGKDATDVDVTNTNIAVTLPTDEIDTLQGGEGENRFVLTGTPPTKPSSPSDTGVTEDKDKPNQFPGTANDDVIIRSSGDEILLGFKGNDFLSGEGDGNELFGGVDNDTLVGGSGGQTLYGNKNSDLLFGGDGQDNLYGGQDDDTLIGESGSDLLSGDRGNDVLYGVTNFGYTLISDFTPNEDIIQLTGSADNYRLTRAPAGTPDGTGIIRIDAQGNQQYIGVIDGVFISPTGLTNSNFFQFV